MMYILDTTSIIFFRSNNQHNMDSLDCALDLMRRLPPRNVEKNLESLLKLAPELEEDLLSAVDQPLKTAICKKTQKPYLLCDYNRDGNSYRFILFYNQKN